MQVTQELKKMTAFIKQEAMEKAREIHLKADEEFAIEKSKLVRQEKQSIDSQYEKKFKQASMSQQITRSTSSNKTRLRVLQGRQELLDTLFEDARKKIADAAKDKDYDAALKGLILESMYMLYEPKVGIKCKKDEVDKVKKAAEEASKEYEKETGSKTEAIISEKDYLPEGAYVSCSILCAICANSTTAQEVCSSLEVAARSRSTTHMTSGLRCVRPTLCQTSGTLYSAKMRTGTSKTRSQNMYDHRVGVLSISNTANRFEYAHTAKQFNLPVDLWPPASQHLWVIIGSRESACA